MCEEQTVSLVDILEEDEELEEEASAVLAGSDSDHCSYPEGYVKRQALYACNTCTPKGGEAAGVCLACSYKCHEGHELFELYTKRNFRCDCGNGKFKDLQCKLHREKDEVNTLNKYSQNFFGSYCTCSRPYPDPDDPVEDEMIQCVVCEDWLHGRHLGCTVPDGVELQEMICEACMNKNPFLWVYASHLAVPAETGDRNGTTTQPESQPHATRSHSSNVKQETENAFMLRDFNLPGSNEEHSELCGAAGAAEQLKEPQKAEEASQNTNGPPKEPQADGGEEPSCKRIRRDAEASCKLRELQAAARTPGRRGAVFWPSAWRSKLCCCSSCQERLSQAALSFLLDESDTVLAYENKGKSSEEKQRGHDPLMSALDRLNRVQQLEIIHGYNDMKSELKDFLQRFAAEGKVVTSEDIHQFFQQQSERRRRESCT